MKEAVRRTALALLFACLVTAAPQADEPTPLRVAYTEFTIANGLHVIASRRSQRPRRHRQRLGITSDRGHEGAGRTGFAHLFDDVMR